MAKPARQSFTAAEKSALLAEIEQLYRAGGRTYVSIARQLGLRDNSYHSWLSQGIRPLAPAPSGAPAPACKARVTHTAEDRQRLVAEVERLHAEGQSIASSCRSLGIRDETFRVWRAQGRPLPALRPVEITALVPLAPTVLTLAPARPARASLSLLAPGGYRVEGLAIEDVAALLRALA
jgi:transposase-like protein